MKEKYYHIHISAWFTSSLNKQQILMLFYGNHELDNKIGLHTVKKKCLQKQKFILLSSMSKKHLVALLKSAGVTHNATYNQQSELFYSIILLSLNSKFSCQIQKCHSIWDKILVKLGK